MSTEESTVVVGVRLPPDIVNALKEVARQTSAKKGETLSYNDLIREAIYSYYCEHLNKVRDVEFQNFVLSFAGVPFYCLNEQDAEVLRHCKPRTEHNIKILNAMDKYIAENSFARKLLHTDLLRAGDLSRYDRRNATNDVYIWSEKQLGKYGVVRIVEGTEINATTDEITAHPCIDFREILKGLRDFAVQYCNETIKTAAIKMIYEEETILLTILAKASMNTDNYLADDVKMYFGERDNILIPESKAQFFYDIFGDEVPLTLYESRKRKGRFILFNNEMLNDRAIIFSNDKNNRCGVMPIRQSLTVLSADDPKNFQIGWAIYEDIGEFVEVGDPQLLRFLRF